MFSPFDEPWEVFFKKRKCMMLGMLTKEDEESDPKVLLANIENGKMIVVELEEVRICPEEFDLEGEGEDREEGEEWKDGKSPVE